MALPALRALKYEEGKEEDGVEGIYQDVYGENWAEVHYSYIITHKRVLLHFYVYFFFNSFTSG